MSRLNETIQTVPPITQGSIIVCVVIYVAQFLLDINLSSWTLNPAKVVSANEWYRILSSPLLHLNLMHIGMNMMSAYAINVMLEKRLGSLRILCIMLSSIVSTGIIHVFLAWFSKLTLGIGWLMSENSLGFSGVLFHLSVLECNLGSHGNRSVFGFFEVQASFYPWVLLVVLQVIMPNISFAGHLSGILAGTLQLYGLPIIPNESYLRRMDECSQLRSLTSFPSFVATTSQTIGLTNRGFTYDGFHTVSKMLKSIRETVTVALFGRGDTINANIRLGRAAQDTELQVDLVQKDDNHKCSEMV